ncbi:hypothetical protein C9Z55_25385, partial (plasmid) [Escherichia coli]
KKLIMLPSETMIWQPEFTDKTLSRKPGRFTFENQFCGFSKMPSSLFTRRYWSSSGGTTICNRA